MSVNQIYYVRTFMADTDLTSSSTDANAVDSPLFRLPTEIRQIILRMVVGDKLIHVFKHYSVSISSLSHNDHRKKSPINIVG